MHMSQITASGLPDKGMSRSLGSPETLTSFATLLTSLAGDSDGLKTNPEDATDPISSVMLSPVPMESTQNVAPLGAAQVSAAQVRVGQHRLLPPAAPVTDIAGPEHLSEQLHAPEVGGEPIAPVEVVADDETNPATKDAENDASATQTGEDQTPVLAETAPPVAPPPAPGPAPAQPKTPPEAAPKLSATATKAPIGAEAKPRADITQAEVKAPPAPMPAASSMLPHVPAGNPPPPSEARVIDTAQPSAMPPTRSRSATGPAIAAQPVLPRPAEAPVAITLPLPEPLPPSSPMTADPAPLRGALQTVSVQNPDWPAEAARLTLAELTPEGGTMEIELTPGALGRLRISVTIDGDAARVTILTETPEAAMVLTEAEPQLASEFSRAGVTLEASENRADPLEGQRNEAKGDPRGHGAKDSIGNRAGSPYAAAPEPTTPLPVSGLLNLIA